MRTQIIALGGGGFSDESKRSLDNYILQATGKAKPRVCFVPTASGDSADYVARFYQSFSQSVCEPTDLALFRRSVSDLVDFACSQDLIYVGGGNTANMLAIWRAHEFDKALRAAFDKGVVLAGISAGGICWFEQGVDDSFGAPHALSCLGFLQGSNCPHYDGEVEQRPSYHRLVEAGMCAGFAADDGVGLHFVNGALHAVVSSRSNARAYRVQMIDGVPSERPIPARLLTEDGEFSHS